MALLEITPRRALLNNRRGSPYIFLDRFNRTSPAPLSSPRPAEPGPGVLTFATPALWSITGGVLQASGDDAAAFPVSLARSPGLALLTRTMNNGTMYGKLNWSDTSNGFGLIHAVGVLGANDTFIWVNAAIITLTTAAFANGVWHDLMVVLRSSGAFYFTINNGGSLTLVWVDNAISTTPLYAAVWSSNLAANPSYDDLRVINLGGYDSRFASDYGLATSRTAAPIAGTPGTHEVNAVIELTITFDGTAGQLAYRRQDANNYFSVWLDPITGHLQLYEVLAGVATYRAGVANAFIAPETARLVITVEGNVHKMYKSNSLLWTYTDALNLFPAATGLNLGNVSGGVTDLVAWPRTVSLPVGI